MSLTPDQADFLPIVTVCLIFYILLDNISVVPISQMFHNAIL